MQRNKTSTLVPRHCLILLLYPLAPSLPQVINVVLPLWEKMSLGNPIQAMSAFTDKKYEWPDISVLRKGDFSGTGLNDEHPFKEGKSHVCRAKTF